MIQSWWLSSRALLLLVLFIIVAGYCPNDCTNRGICNAYDRCECFKGFPLTYLSLFIFASFFTLFLYYLLMITTGIDHQVAYTGADCSLYTCPKGYAWVSDKLAKANDIHPMAECSNKGVCDRGSGSCMCYSNYEGLACEKLKCLNDCNNRGVCLSQQQLADEAGRVYDTPWDANKIFGCVCDHGYRGRF